MIYLDNAATEYVNDNDTTWINPNTKYAHEANKTLQDAESRMMDLLGVSSGMIVFGGQNVSQLIDLLWGKWCIETPPTNKWITSRYEHDCIWNKSWDWIIDDGSAMSMIQSEGYIRNKSMFCRMLVNNITGEVFNNKPLGQYCREYNQFFMMDCTAAIGHVELPNDLEQWCDCIVMSGHKFGGGYMGCMWLSDRLCETLNIKESSDLASGTPNVKGIDEFVRAFELANEDIECANLHFQKLYNRLCKNLEENKIEFHTIPTFNYTCAINAIRLPGINADALQQYLSSKQIYIGRGASACDSNDDNFRVLQAYGLTKQEASEVIRVSFNQWNTTDEIDELVKNIKEFKEEYCV